MSSRKIDILTAVFVAVLSLILLRQLEGVPREGAIFPLFLLYGLLVCSALVIIRSLTPGFKNEAITIFQDIPVFFWIVGGLFILYVVGVFNIGFFTSTFLVSWIVTSLLSQSHWKRSITVGLIFSAGITALFYLLFYKVLHVPFPRGLLM